MIINNQSNLVSYQLPGLHVKEWLNHDPVTLDSLRGQVVLIEIFQIICPGCIYRSLPKAAELYKKYNKKGLGVIGIATVFEAFEAQSDEQIKQWLKEHPLPFPVARDDEDHAIKQFAMADGTTGTPMTVLIDKEGTVRLHFFGSEEHNLLLLESTIKDLLEK